MERITAQEINEYYTAAGWGMPSPLEARAAAIEAALKDEPLSLDEAMELIDELSEIYTQIEKE